MELANIVCVRGGWLPQAGSRLITYGDKVMKQVLLVYNFTSASNTQTRQKTGDIMKQIMRLRNTEIKVHTVYIRIQWLNKL